MLVAIVDDDEELCREMAAWVEAFQKKNPTTGKISFFHTKDAGPLLKRLVGRKKDAGPTLVLLDLAIDGDPAAGLATLDRLKQSKEAHIRDLPVVIYSNTDDEDEIRNCYRRQANTYVCKGNGGGQKAQFMSLMKYWTETATVPS